jgi:hypothetical protein
MVTVRTEAAAAWLSPFLASRFESPFVTQTILSSSNIDLIAHSKQDMPTSGSRMLSKQDWEDLKPTIRRLYLDENMTLKQLADYIQKDHGVKPT